MAQTPQFLDRPGGRRVAVHDLTPGAPDEAPVVLLSHAAPGAGDFDPDPKATAAHGVRLLSLDRPGYGGSDPTDDFATVDSAADDAAALLDAVLAPGARAGVAGWSAGGRVALALAARRPELVSRVAVIGTPAPDEEVSWIPAEHMAGLDALRGQPAPVAQAALTPVFEPMLVGASGADRLGLVGAADVDAPVLAGDGVADRLGTMLDSAVAQGSVGLVADLVGYTLRPWGFDPADVRAPVLLAYGAADAIGPEHGRWWASRLPAARLEEHDGLGHLLVVPTWDRTLSHLTG
ncbi:alpha/beta fold hydrolase [Pseudonocardia humida]|uniref:Alpha/beta hydrolase n=1 Tax=Pseudonocardia humida TaxID=2800819 RepID=A0ABT0ZWW1_9PSEU|nr:alpha/beta fold hydrolase [Pseudonocardia humida]MCO1655196.1 alpha/beta hydrolase [Pseudonocardia humida]